MQTDLGYSLGAVDYILSPVVPDMLRSKVKVFVDLSPDAAAPAPARRRARRAGRGRGGAQGRRGEHAALAFLLARQPRARLVARLEVDRRAAARDAGAALRQRGDARALRCRSASFDLVLDGRRCRPTGERALAQRAAPSRSRRPRARRAGERRWRRGVLDAGARPVAGRWSCRCRTRIASSARSASAERPGRPTAGHRRARRALGDRAGERAPLSNAAGRDRGAARRRGRCSRTSNRRKDEFLAMLSHELRNPLAPIRTALEVIRRLAPAEPKLDLGDATSPDRQVRAPDAAGRRPARRRRASTRARSRCRPRSSTCAPSSPTRSRPPAVPRQPRATAARARCPETPVVLRGDFARLVAGRRQPAQQRRQVHRRGRPIELELTLRRGRGAVVSVRDNGIGIDAELLPQHLRAVRRRASARSTAARAASASA